MNTDAIQKKDFKSFSRDKFFDYFTLTKPTITLLVAVTVVPSLLLASPNSLPSLMTCLIAIVGASLASASAAVFNQIVEVDIDVQMNRTKSRSLASKRINHEVAIIFASLLGLTGFALLFVYCGIVATASALAGHLFYIFIYTLYLKKKTDQNIVIGGAAGAVGPLIGWAAITGTLEWPAWVLFFIIFLWTPPHFWALALKYKKDYAEAGIPMYPVIHGDHKTRKVIFLYTLTLLPCTLSLYFFHHAGLCYLVLSSLFTLKFIFDAYRLYKSRSNDRALPFFHYSCLYIFGIFGSLTLDSFVNYLNHTL